MDSNVYESYITQDITFNGEIFFNKGIIAVDGNKFIYKKVKDVLKLIEKLKNDKKIMLEKYYDICCNLYYSSTPEKIIEKTEYEKYISNIKRIEQKIQESETYYKNINNIYFIKYNNIDTQLKNIIEDGREISTEKYQNIMQLEESLYNLKNSRLNKIHKYMISDLPEEEDIKIINLPKQNKEDLMENLFKNNIVKFKDKEECTSIKKSQPYFTNKEEIIKIISNTPELLQIMPPAWKIKTKKELCDLLFSKKKTKDDINEEPVPVVNNNLPSKLKSKTYDECISIKKSDSFFMTVAELTELILNSPELLQIMPVNWKKLKKKELCQLLFSNNNIPLPKEDLPVKEKSKEKDIPVKENVPIKEKSPVKKKMPTIEELMNILINDKKIKFKSKKGCKTLKRSDVEFMTKDEIHRIILNTPELLQIMPANWKKLLKGELCDILFPDKKDKGESSIVNKDKDKDIKIINIMSDLYNNRDIKFKTKDECNTLNKEDAYFMDINELKQVILNNPEILSIMPSNWENLSKKNICDILFGNFNDLKNKQKKI